MNIESPNKVCHYGNKIVYSCQYHVVFCTKYRKSLLEQGIIQDRCKELLSQTANEFEFSILAMEVMTDHVHVILDVNPRLGITKAVKLLKGRTSKYLREEFRSVRSRAPCLWTGSYFVSSVGVVSLEVIKRYIEDQKNK